jgi:hypothetical protein
MDPTAIHIAKYDAAVAARNNEIATRWNSNTAFLIANSVGFALLVTDRIQRDEPLIGIIALFGLVLCGAWWRLNELRLVAITHWSPSGY